MPKQKLFTPAVLEQVPRWVASGQTAAEISARIGCTPGTLRVRCSRAGISLKRRRRDPAPNSTRPRRMSVRLPRPIISIIQTHAERKGITAEMAQSVHWRRDTGDRPARARFKTGEKGPAATGQRGVSLDVTELHHLIRDDVGCSLGTEPKSPCSP